MESCSIKRLAESKSDQVGDWSNVCTKWSFTTPGSIEKLVYVLVNIYVGREPLRWWFESGKVLRMRFYGCDDVIF